LKRKKNTDSTRVKLYYSKKAVGLNAREGGKPFDEKNWTGAKVLSQRPHTEDGREFLKEERENQWKGSRGAEITFHTTRPEIVKT